MTIYDALPKEYLPNSVDVILAIGSIELEFPAESPEFRVLTQDYEVPLSEEAYRRLLAASPPGWRQAFELLRADGII